jgi:hypothetical protein
MKTKNLIPYTMNDRINEYVRATTENLIMRAADSGTLHSYIRAVLIRVWLDGEISDSFIEKEVRHVIN